jgi:ABC-type Fe3+-hydroxamate transport system substrate-binding protein
MRRLLILLLTLLSLVLLTACPAKTEQPTQATNSTTILTYFVRNEKLGVAGRQVTLEGNKVATAAMNALLTGPTPVESDAGLSTAIPSGTKLLYLAVFPDGLATVDLSDQFDDEGNLLSMQLRMAQVVATLTQFPTIKRVHLQINGETVDSSTDLEEIENVTPQVLVESLWPQKEVSELIPFSGTASTFEATILWQIEKPDGTVITKGTVLATSGTGTRGTFNTELNVDGFRGEAILVTGGESGEDASFVDEVRIPIIVV